jgi:hypothetical protein
VGTSVFPENSPDNGGKWENFTFTWNSGSSTRADLVLLHRKLQGKTTKSPAPSVGRF